MRTRMPNWKKRFLVPLTPATAEQIKVLAKAADRSLSSYMRRIVEQHVARTQAAGDDSADVAA
jgi:hypothetical protein